MELSVCREANTQLVKKFPACCWKIKVSNYAHESPLMEYIHSQINPSMASILIPQKSTPINLSALDFLNGSFHLRFMIRLVCTYHLRMFAICPIFLNSNSIALPICCTFMLKITIKSSLLCYFLHSALVLEH